MALGLFDLRWTSSVRTVAGRRLGGGAAVQLRRGAERVPRPRRRVSRLHAVRGHPVCVRGQYRVGPAHVRVILQHLPNCVLHPFLAHARVAALPVQPRPLRGRQVGTHVCDCP